METLFLLGVVAYKLAKLPLVVFHLLVNFKQLDLSVKLLSETLTTTSMLLIFVIESSEIDKAISLNYWGEFRKINLLMLLILDVVRLVPSKYRTIIDGIVVAAGLEVIKVLPLIQ